jgi:hypothetical protein
MPSVASLILRSLVRVYRFGRSFVLLFSCVHLVVFCLIPICSLVRSLARYFIRFFYSFIPFARSLARSSVPFFVCSFVNLFVRSSFVNLFVRSSVCLLICSLLRHRLFACSFVSVLIMLFFFCHVFVHLFASSFVRLFCTRCECRRKHRSPRKGIQKKGGFPAFRPFIRLPICPSVGPSFRSSFRPF